MKVPVSARLDETLLSYLDTYQKTHAVRTRSEALEQAISALRERDLKQEYMLAMAEWDASGEQEVWDEAVGDGLEPTAGDAYETW